MDAFTAKPSMWGAAMFGGLLLVAIFAVGANHLRRRCIVLEKSDNSAWL